VIIAMIAMLVVEVAIDQIVNMVAMRHCFMSAARPMSVSLKMARAFVPRCATLRISLRYAYHVFIGMAAVRVMQVPIVQITDVIIMHDPGMAALRSVWMSMIFMLGQDTISGHCVDPQ
jgi:hypothetical protein